MVKLRGRTLVVDTSVAQAAGDREAVPSRSCTDFLEAIRDLKHRVAMATPLLEEWHRHESGFARRWLRTMFARRCVDMLDATEDAVLREALRRAAPRPKIAAILLKDAHLIEIAVAADRRIAALDEDARAHFGQAALVVQVLRTIHWINPGRAEEEAVGWLRAGAPDEKHRMLGHFAAGS